MFIVVIFVLNAPHCLQQAGFETIAIVASQMAKLLNTRSLSLLRIKNSIITNILLIYFPIKEVGFDFSIPCLYTEMIQSALEAIVFILKNFQTVITWVGIVSIHLRNPVTMAKTLFCLV